MAAVALVFVAVSAARVRAYEDQATLGVAAGYGFSATSERPRHSALLDVSASFGLSQTLALRANATYGFAPADTATHSVLLGGELLYLVDIVEVVPYFGLGVSGIGWIAGGDFDAGAAVQLALGLDYHLSRDLALELDVRPHLLVTEWDDGPFYLTAVAGLLWLFDT